MSDLTMSIISIGFLVCILGAILGIILEFRKP